MFEPAAVDRLLSEARLDAVVATSAPSVVWLSGYGTWLEEKLRGWMSSPAAGNTAQAGFAVLDRSRAVGLVASPLFREAAQSSAATRIAYVERPGRPTGREPLEALARVIGAIGVSDGRLGVELDGAPPTLRAQLATLLPGATILDCSWLLRLARQYKSAEALRRLRAVKAVTLSALRDSLAAGSTPAHLASGFRECLATAGADLDHVVYGLPGGGVSLGAADAQWPTGLVYLDAGARLAHFYSDVGRTARSGTGVSRSDSQRLARAREALLVGAGILGPGTRCSEVHRAMADVTEQDGALRAHGHGLGLEIREWPIVGAPPPAGVIADDAVTTTADVVLEAGMVVNLEVSGFFGTGSLQVEETFEIGSDGARPLGGGGADEVWEL